MNTPQHPHSSDAYGEALTKSFEQRYQRGEDFWTGEDALQQAAFLLCDRLQNRGKGLLLDIGIGAGTAVEPFLERGNRIVGVDLHRNEAWPGLTRKWGDRLQFVKTNYLDWQGWKHKFDAVLDNGCFHHQHPDHYEAYLRKIKEHSKPGALLSLCVCLESEPDLSEGRIEYVEMGRIDKSFQIDELRELMKANGFQWLEGRRIQREMMDTKYLVAHFNC